MMSSRTLLSFSDGLSFVIQNDTSLIFTCFPILRIFDIHIGKLSLGSLFRVTAPSQKLLIGQTIFDTSTSNSPMLGLLL
jgi:hypothetical protein